MKLSDLKSSGHWPTLLTAFLYFDFSFMAWTVLGPLGAQVGESLHLDAGQKGLMVAVPILAGAILRFVLGLAVDRFGAKATGITAQLIVMGALATAWLAGLSSFTMVLMFGALLGFAGASFAVALPQAGRWYPPRLQGVVLGLAGAGNVGVVLDSLIAPRLAAAYGFQAVFGIFLIPALVVFVLYIILSKEAPGEVKAKKISDYINLLKQKDAHWFCFYYTVSFGGFVGLASYYVLYYKSEFGLTPVAAGDKAALCTLAGALLRPVGGAIADRIGGIRSLTAFYSVAAVGLIATAFTHNLNGNLALFLCISGALGMANGSVFQLLPQRFGKDIGVMTGLVGCGGGVGGFYLATSLGYARSVTGSCSLGFLAFAGMCVLALVGLALVKTRWRTTWGALSEARI